MSKPKDQRYVHKPIDKFGFVVDVGYYKPNGEWVPAPRIKGFMNLVVHSQDLVWVMTRSPGFGT